MGVGKNSWWWDADDSTFRGSAVNLILTVVFVGLVVVACFNNAVCERVLKLTELIIGIYFTSLGVWKVGAVIKYNKDADMAAQANSLASGICPPKT